MFSGIVQALSKKVVFTKKDYGYQLSVSVPESFTKKIKRGDSVAVNGVCLTVVDFKKNLRRKRKKLYFKLNSLRMFLIFLANI